MSVYTIIARRSEEHPTWFKDFDTSIVRGKTDAFHNIVDDGRQLTRAVQETPIEKHQITSPTLKCAYCKQLPASVAMRARREGPYHIVCSSPACRDKAMVVMGK